MNDTYVTVSGVVATKPRHALVDGSVPVTSFRVASTSRRYDKQARDWVDGTTTWVTVTCWRTLALNVWECLAQKDRVVVHGKLRTPEWVADGGARRSGVEIDAESVGHDLMFGTASFTRRPRAVAVEPANRREADALARAVELDAMSTDLAALLGGPQDYDGADGRPGGMPVGGGLEDGEPEDGEAEDGELSDGGLSDGDLDGGDLDDGDLGDAGLQEAGLEPAAPRARRRLQSASR